MYFKDRQHRIFTFYFEIHLNLQKSCKNNSLPISPASSDAPTTLTYRVKPCHRAARLSAESSPSAWPAPQRARQDWQPCAGRIWPSPSSSWFLPRWYFKTSLWIESCAWWSYQDIQMPDADLDVTHIMPAHEPTGLWPSVSDLTSVLGKDSGALKTWWSTQTPLPSPPGTSCCHHCGVLSTDDRHSAVRSMPANLLRCLSEQTESSLFMKISWVLL